jgi:hypothetical protein
MPCRKSVTCHVRILAVVARHEFELCLRNRILGHDVSPGPHAENYKFAACALATDQKFRLAGSMTLQRACVWYVAA